MLSKQNQNTFLNAPAPDKFQDGGWWWTHIIAVEGIEDPRDIAAEDANGNPRIVQRHPAATGLLWAVATE